MGITEDDLEDSIHYDNDDVSSRQTDKNNIISLGDDEVLMGVSPMAVRLPKEETATFLLRMSHLHCQNKMINMIADLRSVRNLTVLYLYNNRIKVIDCLSHVPHLKFLYLQNNDIEIMDGMEDLHKLGKYCTTY